MITIGLCVIIPAYRGNNVRLCISALKSKLRCSYPITILVGKNFPDSLEDLEGVTEVDCIGLSYAENVNKLLRLARQQGFDVIFHVDEQFLLGEDLDVTRHVNKLRHDPTAGLIRLMGILGHHFVARLQKNYWKILWDSPELYIASLRPHLKHIRFHDVYGLYPNVSGMDVEEAFCHQCRDIAREVGGPDVLIPVDEKTETAWAEA